LHFFAIETENDFQFNTPCVAPESDGWYRTFLKEPRGIIQLADRRRPASQVHAADATVPAFRPARQSVLGGAADDDNL
jgi:hypothetical protein